MMRHIDGIVIHGADTYPDMDIGVEEIRQWHLERGWRDVGYHYVIRRNGTVEHGRREEEIGAHVKGHNDNTIGICLVGGKARGRENPCNYTRLQWAALTSLVTYLTSKYKNAVVVGHTDLDEKKTCPGFDAIAWWGK